MGSGCNSHHKQTLSTGKSLSEALIFASTNPQYDNRLFIFHENCKLRIPAEHVVYTNCCFCFVLTFRTILVHNMFWRCCELLKKDLSVPGTFGYLRLQSTEGLFLMTVALSTFKLQTKLKCSESSSFCKVQGP